ncbi:MAG: phenylalanine--tRNA ligase subunit beta, partial [Tepidisphaeraceae bacterium]
MKLNTAWLLQYLDTPIDHRELIDAMPRAGLEVEAEAELKEVLAPVRIGFVREKRPLDNAPGMFATKIEIERGQFISVLVGSEHEVQVGWGVPVAPAGMTLPTGKKVAAGNFHGVESTGMICLDGELGLIARGSGMHHWTDEASLGQRFVDLVHVPEYLIELKVLPNRPDCLGLLGISREIAALFNVKTKCPTLTPVPAADGAPVPVEIREPALCRRLTAAAFRNVKVAPSPAWLKSVLLTAGMRPINNVVDITNFVMYEAGQPMHAFDLKRLAGPKLVVRKLAAGETLELLSGKTIDDKIGQPLVIADAERPRALAGIMGGKAAETNNATTDLLLEVAYFDPVHVRGNVKALRKIDGVGGTDASYRFERGVDPNAMLDWARQRAYALIHDLAGATLAATPTDVYPEPVKPREFVVQAERVGRMIGATVTGDVVRRSLQKLGYAVTNDLRVTVPTYRVDVNDPVVLMEDVARMIGYDNIAPVQQPARATRGQTSKADRLKQAIARTLVNFGFYETKNDPLESESRAKWLGKPADAIVLQNAATAEMNTLRRTLLTGLAASAQRNVFRGATQIRLFEIDRTFGTLPGVQTLGGIAGGTLGRGNWRGESKIDFHTLVGELQDLFDALGIPGLRAEPLSQAPLRDGAAARLLLGDLPIGIVGALDPKAIKLDRLAYELFVFEIDLAAVEPRFERPITYTPVNKLPASVRDLAIVLKLDIPYAKVEHTIRTAAGAQLESLQLVDDYRGPPIVKGDRSLAMRLTFRDAARTLTSDEVT